MFLMAASQKSEHPPTTLEPRRRFGPSMQAVRLLQGAPELLRGQRAHNPPPQRVLDPPKGLFPCWLRLDAQQRETSWLRPDAEERRLFYRDLSDTPPPTPPTIAGGGRDDLSTLICAKTFNRRVNKNRRGPQDAQANANVFAAAFKRP